MKKMTLYSSSARARKVTGPSASIRAGAKPDASAVGADAMATAGASKRGWRYLIKDHQRTLLAAASALLVIALVLGHAALTPSPREITQHDIDAAVLHTLEHAQLPSRASKAYEAIRRSVVRVHGIGHEKEKDGHVIEGVGTGVVIVDSGIILTNLHVVSGAERVEVEFEDGTESEATVIGARPEHDLAVLQAKKLPDDLPAATLRSTADLAVGDEVIAVGFPFGIGPSVSAGVVSGLRREYDAKDRPALTNLIQFDAAVNPAIPADRW
jgi:S1-C subfamily serine protease